MTKVLLSLHVLAGILSVGPVTVAASLFPRASAGVRPVLHRITKVYGVLGLSVPVLGLATALSLGVLGDAWVTVSIGLTALAGVLLALVVLPWQAEVLAGEGGGDGAPDRLRRLAMVTGVFSLLWAVVVVLMIVRPGSTTSA